MQDFISRCDSCGQILEHRTVLTKSGLELSIVPCGQCHPPIKEDEEDGWNWSFSLRKSNGNLVRLEPINVNNKGHYIHFHSDHLLIVEQQERHWKEKAEALQKRLEKEEKVLWSCLSCKHWIFNDDFEDCGDYKSCKLTETYSQVSQVPFPKAKSMSRIGGSILLTKYDFCCTNYEKKE